MMNNEQTPGNKSMYLDEMAQTGRPTVAQKSAQTKKKSAKSSKPKWLRVTLRIIKFLIIPIVFVIAILAGLWIGYSKLGKQPSSEIFQLETWKHLFDLVFAEK